MTCSIATACVLLAVSTARAQMPADWTQPAEPFRIADDLYYVGSSGISSFLLVGSEGNILIDTGLPANVPLVRASIEKLGFKLADVKILLSSHAHFDHVAGHAEMQKLTGARVMALGDDAEALSTGKDLSALGSLGWAPVKVDRVLKGGDVVQLGHLSLTAHHTPGHTKGCTTWTAKLRLDGAPREAVFIGGTSINNGVKLLDNARHPAIAQDYARTFEVLKSFKAELFLAQHPQMFDMAAKAERLRAGDKSAFVDADGYAKFVAAQDTAYTTQLQKEQSARGDAR